MTSFHLCPHRSDYESFIAMIEAHDLCLYYEALDCCKCGSKMERYISMFFVITTSTVIKAHRRLIEVQSKINGK